MNKFFKKLTVLTQKIVQKMKSICCAERKDKLDIIDVLGQEKNLIAVI
jgi:hypothetical protein